MSDSFHRPLHEVDPELAGIMNRDLKRQQESVVLIPSENYASPAVLAAQGSVLGNKYAEGYPGKRYYNGCELMDEIEALAIHRAKQLFKADHVNVQPHSGSQANVAVFFALLEPGDRIVAMRLDHGGHLSHGIPKNIAGKLYDVAFYGVDKETGRIDLEEVADLVKRHRPKLLIVGGSAYPRTIDFERFRAIADAVGAYLVVDMAHFAGLVAAGVHPNPVPYADVVTSTTHKTLRGPRGGLILSRDPKLGKKIDKTIFPGIQGGPLEHVIAGKAVAFFEAMQPGFRSYARTVVENAQALAEHLAHRGYRIVSGGTDNHLFLVDLRPAGLTGAEAEDRLGRAGITVNKNGIPFDPQPPRVTSGIRVGTAAITTRGFSPEEMAQVAEFMDAALRGTRPAEELREGVRAFALAHPMP